MTPSREPVLVSASEPKQAAAADLASLVRADAFRQIGRFSWRAFFGLLLRRRTFRPVVTLRLCQAAASSPGAPRILLPLLRVLHRWTSGAAGLDLPWTTEIGPGFCISHGWGAVISPGARIGKNVTLFHGATLGRRDRIDHDGVRTTEYPVIEDEVWIGPHAIVVGGVTVGRGSRIAAGAFVTEAVPPFTIVAGNPMTILKTNCVPDVINPAP